MESIVNRSYIHEHSKIITALASFNRSIEVPVVPSNLFGKTFSSSSKKYLGERWADMSYLWDKYGLALKFAREDKLMSSEECFIEARKYCTYLNESALFYYFADVFSLTALAYLRFKQERFEEAQLMLEEVIEIDAFLIAEGFYILEYHRVQQLHNLARLYFKQNRLYDGAQMISEGLRFMLLGHTPTIVPEREWLLDNLKRVPSIVRTEMIYQLTNETIGIFLAHYKTHNELIKKTFFDLDTWTPKSDCEEWNLKWIVIKKSLSKLSTDIDIDECLHFLVHSPIQYDNYKLSLIYDLTDIYVEDFILASELKRIFKEYVSSLRVNNKISKAYYSYLESDKTIAKLI